MGTTSGFCIIYLQSINQNLVPIGTSHRLHSALAMRIPQKILKLWDILLFDLWSSPVLGFHLQPCRVKSNRNVTSRWKKRKKKEIKLKAERPESAVTDELNSQISKNHPELPRIFNNEAKLSSAANWNPFETNCTAQVIQSSCNRINIHRFHSIEMHFFLFSLSLEWLNGIKKLTE